MDLSSTVLVLLSALLHPLRDLTLKAIPQPELAYLGVTASWVAIAALQTAGSGQSLLVPMQAWPAVAVSAAGLTAYYFGTMAALRLGDLSVYYPIIRSSPLMIVAIGWAFLGSSYSVLTLTGIAAIVCSGFAIQYQRGKVFANPQALALAVLAMIGSAAYTLADAHAMKTTEPAAFLFWVYALLTPAFAIVAMRLGPEASLKRPVAAGNAGTGNPASQSPPAQTAGPRNSAGSLEWLMRIGFAAATSYLSYYLILTAFRAGADAAATSAVRQASIPVSVVLAALFLGETRFLHRLGWACVLAMGIALVAFAG